MIPWRHIFKVLAEKYYWKPSDVMVLTMRQVRIYMGSVESTSPTTTGSKIESEVIKNRLTRQKQEFLEWFTERLREG